MLHLARPQDWVDLPSDTRDYLRQLLDSGHTLLAEGRYMAANDQYLLATIMAPGFLPAHARLAELYLARGNRALAEAKFSAMVDICLLRGQIAQALEAYQQWLDLVPEEAARTRLVRLLLDETTPGVGPHLLTASTYLKARRVDEALHEFREAAAAFPDGPLAHEWYARALGSVGRFAEAAAEIELALRDDPASPALLAQSCAAYVAQDSQQGHAAFERLAGALKGEPSGIGWALAALEALPWPRSTVPEPVLWLGVRLLRQGLVDAARPLLSQSVRHPATATVARVALGSYYLSVGRLPDALAELKSADGPAPGQGKALIALAEPHLATPSWEKVVQVLRQVQRLDPDEEGAYIKSAEAYFKRGRPAESLQDFARLAELYVRRNQTTRAAEVQRIIAQIKASYRQR